MATLNREKVRTYITKRIFADPKRAELRKKALQNSIRRAQGNHDLAMQRILFADDLITERMFRPSQRAQRMVKAKKSSEEKHGASEAFQRQFAAQMLRDGREKDAAREWGISFNAGLKRLNSFFRPIQIDGLIQQQIATTPHYPLHVLEIGTGMGKGVRDLAGLFGKKVSLTATGIKWLPEWKRQKQGNTIQWRVTHAQNLKRIIRSGSQDIVFSNLGVNHVTNPAQAVTEAHRALRKGGLFLFTTEHPFFTNGVPPTFELMQQSTHTRRPEGRNQKIFTYLLRKK